jgi:hypothetical protein
LLASCVFVFWSLFAVRFEASVALTAPPYPL